MTINEPHDTIFDENAEAPSAGLADIHFDLLEGEGKWLLKVISGPNSGAEFFLMPESTYVIGTDETSCDIVFNDLSVSRQHARLLLDKEQHITLEDLQSRNGTFIDGEKSEEKKDLPSNALITMGTTTFMLIDRESEHNTIIGPTIAIEQKEEEKEKKKKEELEALQKAALPPIQSEVERIKEQEKKEERRSQTVSAFILLAILSGIFVLAGLGTTMLFRTQKINQNKIENPSELIAEAIKEFPSIRYNFNPSSGKLLLVGHIRSEADRADLFNNLTPFKFVHSIDSRNLIVDEFVWREMNTLFSKNPAWRSITITATAPGHFLLTGFLNTREEAEELNNYLNQYFGYIELLEKKLIVEEDLKAQIAQMLLDNGFRTISIGLDSGELVLSGSVAAGTKTDYDKVVGDIRELPGIKKIASYVSETAQAQAYIDLSDRYQVTGYSAIGTSISVIVNGKIVTKGDFIDGMRITDIQKNTIILEKEGFKYKIDFNR